MRRSNLICKALMALSAFGIASASAADLPARVYSKAPPVMAAVPSWTGCYVGGGGGYGLWNQENTMFDDTTVPRTQISGMTTNGGRGYFGTAQAGCDYQFGFGGYNLVVGAFGDYDFASLKGNINFDPAFGAYGQEKMTSQWAAGGRVGWLVTPSLLTYFSAGYTESRFGGVNLLTNAPPVGLPLGLSTDPAHYRGYFIGAGDEYALSFVPGLFWKTEYRFSDMDTRTNSVNVTGTGAPTGLAEDSHKYIQSVRSELVYRFNWSGPVVAKY